jgi:hypothetical protein
MVNRPRAPIHHQLGASRYWRMSLPGPFGVEKVSRSQVVVAHLVASVDRRNADDCRGSGRNGVRAGYDLPADIAERSMYRLIR